MNKFNYVLGWIALIGAPLVVISFISVALLSPDESVGLMAIKMIWMPFVCWWGYKQVKEYRAEVR